MKITVIGAGYVGLVTSVCFAELGNDVICVEKIHEKVQKLKQGKSTIYEPGLDLVLKKNLDEGRIKFVDDVNQAINYSEVIFICVGTPQSNTGKADLSQIEHTARQIAQNMTSYKLIIEKSTVPVNTHQWIYRTVKRYAKKDIPFDVASNPEFLREGCALEDFMKPDRIVVGTDSDRAKELFRQMYKPFTDKGYPLLITTTPTAEFIKHTANSMLAMKISYMNMVAELCEKVGADVEMVAKGIGLDKRIGHHFLNAGIGYGGSCFPKDVKAFIRIANDFGVDFGILKEVEKVNSRARERFVDKIEEVLWINKDKKIAVWGLSFKPNTDDVREAPSIGIIQRLINDDANLSLYDPQAEDNFMKVIGDIENISYVKDKYDAVKDANVLLILTEWEEFRKADLDKVKSLMKLPIIMDGRNIYQTEDMEKRGFEYYPVGKESVTDDY
jgi:UDPglucose 6-dehydrogenase